MPTGAYLARFNLPCCDIATALGVIWLPLLSGAVARMAAWPGFLALSSAPPVAELRSEVGAKELFCAEAIAAVPRTKDAESTRFLIQFGIELPDYEQAQKICVIGHSRVPKIGYRLLTAEQRLKAPAAAILASVS